MSEENVQIVRQIYNAWKQGESAGPFLHEDVEYVNPDYAVESGTRRGRDSFRKVRDIYDRFDIRTEDFLDAGDDVVVLAWFTAVGRGSGVTLEGEHGYVWTIRNGRAIRFRWFQSHTEALAAGGLKS